MQLFKTLLLFAGSAALVAASADYGSDALFARDAEADFGDHHGLASALNARDAAAEAEAEIDGEHMSLLRRESAAAMDALSTVCLPSTSSSAFTPTLFFWRL